MLFSDAPDPITATDEYWFPMIGGTPCKTGSWSTYDIDARFLRSGRGLTVVEVRSLGIPLMETHEVGDIVDIREFS